MLRRSLLKIKRRCASVILLSGSIIAWDALKTSQRLKSDSSGSSSWIKYREVSGGTPAEKISAAVPEYSQGDKAKQPTGGAGSDPRSSNKFFGLPSLVPSVEWSSLGEHVSNLLVPEWVKLLPCYVRKLQREFEMGPSSLAEEVFTEAEDPFLNPEIMRAARVRMGKELCHEEQEFIKRRKIHTTKALARYLDVPEKEINPEDVPTIAICGSGGGLRALVAGTSSYLSAQEAGVFDCATYTAGVSGSCWLQTLYFSSLANQSHQKLIDHLKRRIGVHIAFPPAALRLLTSAPTNKFLLSGIFEKAKADPKANFGIVDVYGVLLAGRLLVPKGELGVNDEDLKISNQRLHMEEGSHPMPIYTAVRHEIPLSEAKDSVESSQESPSESLKEKAKQESWFQWFEWSPYEFWCEEIEAGIPTWSLGRKFDKGVAVTPSNGVDIPEMRMPLLLGIWGSAFCATLSHYYKEIRPVLSTLAGFDNIDELVEERNDDLIKVHPIDPASISNFAVGLGGQLPATTPKDLFSAPHLQLMDAGMSNNLPIYPLLRPGRNVDILIAFDASADVRKDNWLAVADGYARQRGIKGWPVGVGWPREDSTKDETARELGAAQAETPADAVKKISEAKEEQLQIADRKSQNTKKTSDEADDADSFPPNKPTKADLTYCNIWIGTTEERSSTASTPPSKLVDPNVDWQIMAKPDSGIAIIYFPFLPNPKVEGVDPNTSEFMSTWNFIYTPEEIDKVVALARANFEEGKEQTRRCVRAIYERKKMLRLEREREERKYKWKRRLQGHGNNFV